MRILNFENTSDDVDSANEKVSNIFEKMAKRSCKIVKTSRNKNIKRKNPWFDGEIKDQKKTVIDLGKRMKQQPYNLQIKKNLKKMIKRKKNIYIKSQFLINSYIGKKLIQNYIGRFFII